MTILLNLDEMPSDPIAAILWLTGVKEQALAELEAAYAEAYYDARLRGQLDAALSAGPYAKKRVLALTRHVNESRGRTLRWGDRRDPTSTAYRG